MFSAVILGCISACNRWQIDTTAELSNIAVKAERLKTQFAFEHWWKDQPDLRYLGQAVLLSKNKISHQVIPQVPSTAHQMVLGNSSLLLLSKAKSLLFLTLASFPTYFKKNGFLDKKSDNCFIWLWKDRKGKQVLTKTYLICSLAALSFTVEEWEECVLSSNR